MPEKIYDSPTRENLELAAKYRPGYDWIPGYYGPPPGIPEAKKCELDRMNDKEYLYAFLRLSQEQKESLMISEAERRRTFNAHWPIQHVVKGHDLALEGFYYTGVADKVQCAFCCGIIRNWEKGDIPAQSHRAYFSYCKMVQKKPCFNIPFDETDSCKALVTEQLSMQTKVDSYRKPCFNIPFDETDGCKALAIEQLSLQAKADSYNAKELGINTFKPSNIKYALLSTRLETFEGCAFSSPISPHDLASAGFYFTGRLDNVKCFCCVGELYNWIAGDDSWVEHAKWYPGCTFVREHKGVSFRKQARSMMSKEDLEISETLKDNFSDLSFLGEVKAEKFDVKDLLKYKALVRLGLDEELVRRAYELNNDEDFCDIEDLLTLVFALEAKDECLTESTLRKLKIAKESANGDCQENQTPNPKPQKDTVDISELLKKKDDLSEEESRIVVDFLKCSMCKENPVEAALLPCGHFIICESCSRGELPGKCPGCGAIVRAACRAFTS